MTAQPSGSPIMTPEPPDEYQKLVEAVVRAIVAADDEALLLRDGYPKRAAENFARAALSALKLPHVTEQMVERGWSAFVMAMGDIEKDVLLDDMTPDEE